MTESIVRSRDYMLGATGRKADGLSRFSLPARPSAARAVVLVALALLGIAGGKDVEPDH